LGAAEENVMNRRSALLAALFALVQMTQAVAAEPQADAPRSYGGTFILVDHHGKPVMDEAYRGKFMLITFGYTHCPDICPTLLTDVARAVTLLGADGDAVQPLFVTLDPARDTPAVLADYVPSFHPRLIGLTGPEEFVADVAQKYRIKFEKQESKDGDYSIDHTAAIFLMDKDGLFLDRFANGTPPEKIAEKIRERMKTGTK
jgi:cytochrome oxidase Cu insertion factor (SCO1/SenC/PrrC family)